MMTLNEYAVGQADSQNENDGRISVIIDLPAEHVLDDGALIEQVIGQIFERLGQTTVELRILAEA